MRYNGKKSLLEQAIEREDWEVAALCLMLGVVEAANKLPQKTLDALLDELEIDIGVKPHRGSRARKRRGRRGPA
jgi:hypothetical protein